MGTPNSTYTYDENGNMLTDTKRMISQTTYSRGNFPYKLLADNNQISYLYSIDDQRMFKKTVSPTDSVKEFYLHDVSGRVIANGRTIAPKTINLPNFHLANFRQFKHFLY
ncbi:MAG: hypothetical protein M9916_11395 [Crocinitomicaceae bacterium]|nr:hypothetical protein [Crocinitomicaceae bacterium]